jgi:hypothetical protein
MKISRDSFIGIMGKINPDSGWRTTVMTDYAHICPECGRVELISFRVLNGEVQASFRFDPEGSIDCREVWSGEPGK